MKLQLKLNNAELLAQSCNMRCIELTVKDLGDAGTDEKEVTVSVDNFQAYKLALYILSKLDVYDGGFSR